MTNSRKWQGSVHRIPNEWNKMIPMHIVGNMDVPNSISIKIEDRSYGALVDTGAEVSVISSRA